MSSIAIIGGATGTGVFSLLAPSTSTNRTLTLPDSTGTVATAESTLSQFNASGSAPVYACRAWVNFNGTGTVAIRGSGNVSSITDNATGEWTVNLTTALPDVNYAAVASATGTFQTLNSSTYNRVIECTPVTTSTVKTLAFAPNNGVIVDLSYIAVSIFR